MADIYKTDIAYAHESLNGDLQTVSGPDNLKAALMRRWVTVPGTFVFRPEYGAGILRYRNEPMTIATQRRIFNDLEAQTLLEPRVERLVSVSFDIPVDNPSMVKISIVVKPVGQNELNVIIPLGAD